MKFVLRSIAFDTSLEEVKKIAKITDEGYGRNYAVDVEGKYYAPKDILYNLMKFKFEEDHEIFFTRQDFTTQDAIRILKKLGLKVLECNMIKKKAGKFAKLAGLITLGGDSVKDSEDYVD